MTQLTHEQWLSKSQNFQARIARFPYPENLDWYRNIVSLVTIGDSVLDVGCGDEHLRKCLPVGVTYQGTDPFPRNSHSWGFEAEQLVNIPLKYDTVFCLATLDNVRSLEFALTGLRFSARRNIVIVTGLDIEPDEFHTVRVTREMIVMVLGEPVKEVELQEKVWLMEFKMKG